LIWREKDTMTPLEQAQHLQKLIRSRRWQCCGASRPAEELVDDVLRKLQA
jgi:hypothetical protein